ncbi:MAG: hypothetical protein FWD17_10175 [Polyangiaceae bacterium]|nr:hypothetical protein [Polyangiaceae bacterium]
MMTHATALFADRHTIHAALEQLAQAGFSRDAISLVMSEGTHERHFAGEGARPPRQSGPRRVTRPGGVLGAIVTGLRACTPDGSNGSAPLRAGGPLQRALRGPTTLAAVLVAFGTNEPEARLADARVRDGAIVVAVEASQERAALALQLLELSGGSALQAA